MTLSSGNTQPVVHHCPKTAEREGYGTATARGEFAFAPTYPGCPHCERRGLFVCGCGKVGCWDGHGKVTCPWCRHAGQSDGSVEALAAGGDV